MDLYCLVNEIDDNNSNVQTLVTCNVRIQTCCEEGCCHRDSLWVSWVVILPLLTFTLICAKTLCRMVCKRYERSQTSVPLNSRDVQQRRNGTSRGALFLRIYQNNNNSEEEDQNQNVNALLTPPPKYEVVVSDDRVPPSYEEAVCL